MIDHEPALYRERSEEWRVTCHSTGGDTLRVWQTLTRFRAAEHTTSGDSSYRPSSPLVGRRVLLSMTRRGWRLHAEAQPLQAPAVLPGSLLGPALFLPLDSVCTACNGVQWLVERTDTLAEYGYPPPIAQRMFLGSVDSCSVGGVPKVLHYAETSSAVYTACTAGGQLRTVARVLAQGTVEVDTIAHVPQRITYAQHMRILIEEGQQVRKGEMRSVWVIELSDASFSFPPLRATPPLRRKR